MNVEFLVHGTLSKGQTCWKNIDNDYCRQFYIQSHTCNVILDVDVAKRDDGGWSSYYNYLRYNNVTSSRPGSYFGMTLRIDDAICVDVKNMFYLLDTIFKKCIVGTILSVTNNGYNYVCQDSFEEKNKELLEIENKVANLFNSTFISTQDYVVIPSNISRKSASKNINVEDLTLEISKDNLLVGNKLSVSPFYPSVLKESSQSQINAIQNEANKKIRDIQDDCNQKLQVKVQELDRANKAASSVKTQLQNEIDQLKRQLQSKQDELDKVKSNNRKKEVDADINKTTKELKESISKLSGLLAERFPETNRFDREDYMDCSHRGGKHRKQSIFSLYWKKIGAAAIVVILLAIIIGNPFVTGPEVKKQVEALQSQINQKDVEIKLLNEDIDNLNKIIEDLKKPISPAPPSPAPMPVPPIQELGPDDDWTKGYRIDIKGYDGKGIKSGLTYEFNICNKSNSQKINGGKPHNGIWKVNDEVCEEGKYFVKEGTASGTEIIIIYSVNGNDKLTRSEKVK